MINNCIYVYIYIITIHSFCRLVSRSSIDLLHRSEETAGVVDRRGRWWPALVGRCGGAGGWPRQRRWWRVAAALVEGRGSPGRDGRGGEGDETMVAKMNAAALETKTKTKELPDPGQLLAYIDADPLAPVRGWHRC